MLSINKQSGFGVVLAIIIAVVVVAIIGYAGYRVFTANTNKPKNSTTTNNQTSNNTQGSNTQTAKYLDIKELGIKVKLNSSIEDAVYAPFDVPSTDGSKVVGISAQSLIDSSVGDKLVNCSASAGALGLIRATTTAPTYVGGQQALPVDNKTLFKFGNTYYQFVPPQQYCGISDADHQSLLNTATQKETALAESFTTAQLDN